MHNRDRWALMQRIEALRYRAECIEKDAAFRRLRPGLADDLAAQWRHIADQLHALATETEPKPAPSLRWQADQAYEREPS